MEAYLPAVLCNIVDDYTEDIFDNLELMVYDINEKRIRINIEPTLFEEENKFEYLIRFWAFNVSKDYLVKNKISVKYRSYLTRGYLTSVFRYLKVRNTTADSVKNVIYLSRFLNRYYGGYTYKVIFFNHRIKIPVIFFDHLIAQLLYRFYNII